MKRFVQIFLIYSGLISLLSCSIRPANRINVSQKTNDTVQIGYSQQLEVSFNSEIWSREQIKFRDGSMATNPQGQPFEILIHRTNQCVLQENEGRGAPEWWQKKEYSKNLNGSAWQVDDWMDTQKGKRVLVVYHPADSWEKWISLTISNNSDHDNGVTCMKDAEDVLILLRDLMFE